MRQSLALTPRLQQSVRLLQLSSVEFQQELRAALDSNPFLEDDASSVAEEAMPESLDAGHDDAGVAVSSGTDPSTNASDAGVTADTPCSDTTTDFAAAADPYDHGPIRAHNGADNSDPIAWVRTQPSLREQLQDMLCLYRLDERDRELAQLVIEALDDDGYLRQSLSELAALAQPGTAPTDDEWRVALRFVQSLDKPGIGARSLSECLLLQLNAMPEDTPQRDIAYEIIAHDLERLARRELGELQKRIGCGTRALREACALIRKLDPKPGNVYGRTQDNYVVPDVIVRQVRDKFVITVNPAVLPHARINRMYADLFAQACGTSRSPLGQQLQEARWLLRNAQQRFDTIQRVAECIVAHQKTFFQYGEIALKPFVLRDVADELGLHESTISRATGNKYMATPRGIFEFKHFFPRELGTDSGGTCSAAAVRALLKEMIDAEDARDPLSDVTLARSLAQQGIQVARRTVTKYRQQMKVPPAEWRRQV
ncbi:hypothetical protein DFQ28_002031 [Apophysomyces sp. BC1034]|nr:hypothetical protein DFQ28_002031 [Apophysomyces sp. BC1034]